jgi:hypothetical protein
VHSLHSTLRAQCANCPTPPPSVCPCSARFLCPPIVRASSPRRILAAFYCAFGLGPCSAQGLFCARLCWAPPRWRSTMRPTTREAIFPPADSPAGPCVRSPRASGVCAPSATGSFLARFAERTRSLCAIGAGSVCAKSAQLRLLGTPCQGFLRSAIYAAPLPRALQVALAFLAPSFCCGLRQLLRECCLVRLRWIGRVELFDEFRRIFLMCERAPRYSLCPENPSILLGTASPSSAHCCYLRIQRGEGVELGHARQYRPAAVTCGDRVAQLSVFQVSLGCFSCYCRCCRFIAS